jgi:signal peptidase II
VVALGIVAMFGTWLWRADKHMQGICYALIIGGALGNIIDRARFGAVIDFLDFHAMGYHWPAFNVADSAITLGVTLMLLESFGVGRPKPTE